MKLFTMICATALTICASAIAAPIDVIRVHFDTPVVVGETTLPAGNVNIQVLHGTNNSILTARSESGVAAALVVNHVNNFSGKETRTNVVLAHHDGQYKLEGVWFDDHTGFAVLGVQ